MPEMGPVNPERVGCHAGHFKNLQKKIAGSKQPPAVIISIDSSRRLFETINPKRFFIKRIFMLILILAIAGISEMVKSCARKAFS